MSEPTKGQSRVEDTNHVVLVGRMGYRAKRRYKGSVHFIMWTGESDVTVKVPDVSDDTFTRLGTAESVRVVGRAGTYGLNNLPAVIAHSVEFDIADTTPVNTALLIGVLVSYKDQRGFGQIMVEGWGFGRESRTMYDPRLYVVTAEPMFYPAPEMNTKLEPLVGSRIEVRGVVQTYLFSGREGSVVNAQSAEVVGPHQSTAD